MLATRDQQRDDEVEAFVRANRRALLRTATALTAGDRHQAEDLVQSTLVRLYVAWPRAREVDTVAYARRALVNGLIDLHRRPFMRRERVSASPPEPAPQPPLEPLDTDLLAALAALSPGMRAAIVLRHVADLSVEQTAAALDCSVGNVKSQTARGLERLRELLAEPSRTTTCAGENR